MSAPTTGTSRSAGATLVPRSTRRRPTDPASLGRGRLVVITLLLVAAALVAVLVQLTAVAPRLDATQVWEGLTGASRGSRLILLTFRAPRLVVGALAGLAFGVSGALVQRLMRNPLASPDVLGISSGASLAAMVAMLVLGWTGWRVSAAALVGAVAIVAVIAVIVLIATKTTWFQTIWSAMCTAARAAWDFVVAAVKVGVQVLQAIWGAIVAYFTAQWNLIQTVASAVWNAIVAVVQFAIGLIQSVVSAVVGAISAQWQMMQAVASAVWNGVQAVVSAVMNGISAVVSGVINTVVGVFQRVQAVGGAVFGAVAGAARAFGSAVSSIIGFVQSLISAIASIRFPSPPSWLTSMFGGEYAAGPGLTGYMTPPSALQLSPNALHLAQGFPSLSGLGALAGRGNVSIYQDNSTTVKVDGSGIADPQAVAGSVSYAVGRNSRTRGTGYAMNLNG